MAAFRDADPHVWQGTAVNYEDAYASWQPMVPLVMLHLQRICKAQHLEIHHTMLHQSLCVGRHVSSFLTPLALITDLYGEFCALCQVIGVSSIYQDCSTTYGINLLQEFTTTSCWQIYCM